MIELTMWKHIFLKYVQYKEHQDTLRNVNYATFYKFRNKVWLSR